VRKIKWHAHVDSRISCALSRLLELRYGGTCHIGTLSVGLCIGQWLLQPDEDPMLRKITVHTLIAAALVGLFAFTWQVAAPVVAGAKAEQHASAHHD
jgi:hypothetical protein